MKAYQETPSKPVNCNLRLYYAMRYEPGCIESLQRGQSFHWKSSNTIAWHVKRCCITAFSSVS